MPWFAKMRQSRNANTLWKDQDPNNANPDAPEVDTKGTV